jgi:hypothetical protein
MVEPGQTGPSLDSRSSATGGTVSGGATTGSAGTTSGSTVSRTPGC